MASPSQEINLTTSIQYAAYDHTKASADCIAMATVRAPLYEPQSRSAVDIVAVIDRSGSMSGKKLDLVRKTLLFVIDQCKSVHVCVCTCVFPWPCTQILVYSILNTLTEILSYQEYIHAVVFSLLQ